MKQSSNYGYDPNGLLKVVKDANGKETHFSYDSRGNVTQVVDSLGNITDYRYNLRGDKVSEMRYRSKADGTIEAITTTWDYDREGRIKTMTDAANRTTTYEYDLQGHQIAVVDALGRRSRSVYNKKGELIATILPDATPENSVDNPRSQSRYDSAGRKIAEIDPLGRETRYVYDKVGRLIETIYADDTVENWRDNPRSGTEYYTDGLVKAQIDERGNRTEFRYDAVGRQIAVIAADKTPNTLADNPTSRYTYDQAGQQRTVTDALGHVTSYEYDDLGRMVKTIFHDKTFVIQEYDKLGRRIVAVDQNSKRIEYRYDDLGRLTGVKDALLQWTEYGYNEQGQLIFQEDALDLRTTYEYDALGRRTAAILPLGQRSTTTYDEIGNLKTATDFNGKTITYEYDEQRHLTEKQFQNGSRVVYSYTQNGLQDTVTFRNSAGLVTSIYDYDYDVRDRLIKRTDTLGMGISQTTRSIEYGYDLASNQTSIITESGTTTYSYDERNRLDVARFNGVMVADYDYDAANRLTKTTFGNGTEEIRDYDVLSRLKELTSKRLSDNTLLSKYIYTLDSVGNRRSAIETVNGQTRSIAYTYDDLYRLTDESIVDGINGNRTSSYTYDNVGSRLTKTVNGVTTVYRYDGNDRLLDEKVNNAITAEYTYDNNGSTKTKTENGVTATYVWNDEKRLVSATVGTQTVDYLYDDQGIRVSSKQGGVETRYLLDEGITANVWEEYAPNGTMQAFYVYGNDLITQTQTNQTSYYLVDGLGSTRLLTDSQGQLLNSYGYEAFGETTSQSGTTSNKYEYAGEQFDSTLGDYYLRQRFYDTSSGRFGRMDTYEGNSTSPLTLNKYAYANGNPITWTDPTGFYSQNDGYEVEKTVEAAYLLERPVEFPFTTFGSKAGSEFGTSVNPARWIKPDILNYAGLVPGIMSGKQAGVGLFNEIKPLSPSGVAAGTAQMAGYFIQLEQFGFIPDVKWHTPLNPLIASSKIGDKPTDVLIFNIGGILFYTDDTSNRMKKQVQTMTYTSFSEGIEKTKQLLLVGSNSSINELGRSKYLIENANNSLTDLNYALLATLLATALYTARYAF